MLLTYPDLTTRLKKCLDSRSVCGLTLRLILVRCEVFHVGHLEHNVIDIPGSVFVLDVQSDILIKGSR